MKKILLIACISIGVFIFLSIVLRITGVLNYYQISTPANEPGMPVNSRILVSNLIDPDYYDFVCYNYNDEKLGPEVRIHRLMARSGDELKIIDGVVFVNNENQDSALSLKHNYKYKLQSPGEELVLTKKLGEFNVYCPDKESCILQLIESEAISIGIEQNRMIETVGQINTYIQETFNRKWNRDQFGPIVIPENKMFLMGDNRDNVLDSRFIGFIDSKDVVGVVID